MITKNTVLILGAGASFDFGFPLGEKLKSLIIEARSDLSDVKANLIHAGFPATDISDFAEALRKSLVSSVDRFLEYNPKYRLVGAAAIATILLSNHHSFYINSPHKWLEALFNALNPQFEEELGNGRLTVLTYNYDCSFEYILYEGLVNTIGKVRAEKTMKEINVIHLHGRLAPSADPWLPQKNNSATIKDSINLKSKYPNEGIRILHEPNLTMDQFVDARNALNSAQRICFLGFGYDPTNLERLFNKEYPISDLNKKTIFGSAYGRAEIENININLKYFGRRLRFGQQDWDVADFLKKSGILTDNCYLTPQKIPDTSEGYIL